MSREILFTAFINRVLVCGVTLLLCLAAPAVQAKLGVRVSSGLGDKNTGFAHVPVQVDLTLTPQTEITGPLTVEILTPHGRPLVSRTALLTPPMETSLWLILPELLRESQDNTYRLRVSDEKTIHFEDKFTPNVTSSGGGWYRGNQGLNEGVLIASPAVSAFPSLLMKELFSAPMAIKTQLSISPPAWPHPDRMGALSTRQLPDLPEILDQLAAVVLVPSTQEPLTPQQGQALRLFVLNGGQLLVVSGGESQALESPALSALWGGPGRPGVRFQETGGGVVFPPARSGEKPFTPSVLAPRHTRLKPVFSNHGTPVLWQRPLGLGNVWYLGLDLRHQQWYDHPPTAVLQTALRKAWIYSGQADTFKTGLRHALLRLNHHNLEDKSISLNWIFGFLLVYGLGGVGIVLRKRNQPRWIAGLVAVGLLGALLLSGWYQKQSRQQATSGMLIRTHGQTLLSTATSTIVHGGASHTIRFEPDDFFFPMTKLTSWGSAMPNLTTYHLTLGTLREKTYTHTSHGLDVVDNITVRPTTRPTGFGQVHLKGKDLTLRSAMNLHDVWAFSFATGWFSLGNLTASHPLRQKLLPATTAQPYPPFGHIGRLLNCLLLTQPTDLLLFGKSEDHMLHVLHQSGVMPPPTAPFTIGYACSSQNEGYMGYTDLLTTFSNLPDIGPAPGLFDAMRPKTYLAVHGAKPLNKGTFQITPFSSSPVPVSPSVVLLAHPGNPEMSEEVQFIQNISGSVAAVKSGAMLGSAPPAPTTLQTVQDPLLHLLEVHSLDGHREVNANNYYNNTRKWSSLDWKPHD